MPKVAVVMPAFNAEATLGSTYKDLPKIYDYVVVCDDASSDKTFQIAKQLGLKVIKHKTNLGYGANQKSLYKDVLKKDISVVVMVHPDNQYDTKNLPKMINQVNDGVSLVLGVRMKTARQNGMPIWKYLSNRCLTATQNMVFGKSLSEYHSGLRVYRADLLRQMPYQNFSDNFVFDSEVIAWTIANNYRITEVDTECYYKPESSSIKLWPSIIYGLSTLKVLLRFRRGEFEDS